MSDGFRARLPQGVGLGFAASFGHGFGKICKQDREPEPHRNLKFESKSVRMIHCVAHQLNGEQRRSDFHYEHHGIFHERSGVQFGERIPEGAGGNLRVPDRPAFLCLGCHGFVLVPQKVLPAFISRCSRIGPRLRAGKKVNAPTIRITEMSRPVNSGVVTGNVPSDCGTYYFLARLPAIARTGITMKKRPNSMVAPRLELYQSVLALSPANAEPLFAPASA